MKSNLFKPGLWKYALLLLLKGYEEHGSAIGRLGAFNGAVIDPTVSLKQPERIFLGRNVHIGRNCVLWPGPGKITIGDDVLLGPNVQVFASNHGIKAGQLIEHQEHEPNDVHIEADCWIGAGAVIVAGVTVAKGTVVAAGAVVTKNTEPYSIVGGVPAKIISSRP